MIELCDISFPKDDRQFSAVLGIAETVKKSGGRAFLVGGCVRDALMGIESKDFDVEIYGLTSEQLINSLSPKFSLSKVGISFGVIKVNHYDIDLALPRVENKVGAGHRGFIVDTAPNLGFKDAAARRDFTLNAISYDPLTGEIVDPFNGVNDLRNCILRHTSSHFGEDPLRVLRAMQFAARFGFTVASETVAVCRGLSQDELPPERLAGEWEKLLLKGKNPSAGLEFLRQCGWTAFYPELQVLIGCKQSPKWHPEGDVWIHTLLSLDAAVQYRTGDFYDDMCLMLGALCHDFGKPATTVFEEDGRITSKMHPEAGAPIAYRFVKRIWNRSDIAGQVAALVKHHMEPHFLATGNARDAAYRRLALAVKRMDLLHKVACADTLGIRRPDISLHNLDIFIERVNSLAIKDAAPKPILLGRYLMELGVKPGPGMGKILNKCFEAQLEGEFSELTGALEYAKPLIGDHLK